MPQIMGLLCQWVREQATRAKVLTRFRVTFENNSNFFFMFNLGAWIIVSLWFRVFDMFKMETYYKF